MAELGNCMCGNGGHERSSSAWIYDLLAFVLIVVAPASTAGLFPATAITVTCLLQGLAVWWLWRTARRA